MQLFPEMVHENRHSIVIDSRIIKHLVDCIDRAAWHPRFGQNRFPLNINLLGENLTEDSIQLIPVLQSIAYCPKSVLSSQFGILESFK